MEEGSSAVSVEAIENAIELNGVAVEANLAALDWGRRWAHDPAFVEAHAAAKHELPATQMVTVEPVPAAVSYSHLTLPTISPVSLPVAAASLITKPIIRLFHA